MRRLPGLALGVALSTMPTVVSAQEVGDPLQGRELAERVCASCHAVERGQASSPNPQAPRFETIAAVPGMTGTAVSIFLRTPHRAMPNLVLNAEEISNVATYILSLRDSR
ncbi:c-type cytochrome [Inquilinus sp. OTU3971]|uniref:c-type cytochrome n=1 Tax=Inquilinus sp. OTU3971 TaxID=3043855 RepID=UPI00313B7C50